MGAGVADGLPNGFVFVRAEIVEDDDIIRLERGNEKLLDIGQEPLAVNGTFEQAWRIDAVMPQSGQKSRRVPMAVRNFVDEATAALRPSAHARHVGLGPCFVDENQARGSDPALIFAPLDAPSRSVRAVLLARDERLLRNGPPLLPAS